MKTRERILEAFFDLVAEHGYDKTSISMICTTLNINKPSIYYSFKSKEDLLITLFDEYATRYFNLDFETLKGHSYKESLINFGHRIIESYEAHPKLISVTMEYYIQARRIPELSQKVLDFQGEFNHLLKAILLEGINKAEFDIDVDINAQILSALLMSAELSMTYNLGLDNKKIWAISVERLFMEAK